MGYVLGVDLGTSSVKALLVDRQGSVRAEASRDYPLYQDKPGYSEQDPEDWVAGTLAVLKELSEVPGVDPAEIEGVSISGQMHGLVLLDKSHRVLRRAILWNDTRTTAQCREIERALGGDLLRIARNPALEGFTLPKLLWVKENEPQVMAQAGLFLLPKDYVRYRLTGRVQMELSDAAGTLLLDVAEKRWSPDILKAFQLPEQLCAPLIESHELAGTLLPEIASSCGLKTDVKVFGGGADNACGAIGASILKEGRTMASIGTSGVVLSYEAAADADFGGKVHFFNHGESGAFYSMGVTLAAGYSLSWFKETFAPQIGFDELLRDVADIPPGANGLLFTPYLVGERTPHADSAIRASFIGMDGSHRRAHFARAVMEGITFSLNESLSIFREAGKSIAEVVSIGGGARNETWLQMQADIFGSPVVRLASEQGPGMGAAMLAAYGCGWFPSLAAVADAFVKPAKRYEPDPERAATYAKLFGLYSQVYRQTAGICESLMAFR